MRPSLSLRSILVVALLLAGGFAGASSCARTSAPAAPDTVSLDEAVARTIAAGSARVAATITNDAGAVTVAGLTSWVEPKASFVTEADGAPPVEVRVTPTGTWLRSRPDRPWTLVDPQLATAAGTATRWSDLLTTLQPAGPSRKRHLRATHDGGPARIELDGHGRIRRLRIDKASGHLDLRLSDHGTEVEVTDP